MERPSRPAFALLLAGLATIWLTMLLLGGHASPSDGILSHALHIPALVPAARAITWVGEWMVLLPLSVAAAALVFLRKGSRHGLLILAIVFSGRVLVELQKASFGRPRPDAAGRLVHVTSLSFPSAHAANTMVAALALALVAAPPAWRTRAVVLALLFTFTIGLTRPILAVHWPSDVMGGWAFGAFWTLLLVRLAEPRLR
jgi:undecaprenyl-diphosphatase